MSGDRGDACGAQAPQRTLKGDPILVVDDLVKSYGGVVAVAVEHLEIQRGSLTALIGPNGAGKTSLFNVLTGFDSPLRGRWEFDGQNVSGQPTYRLARAGMVRTFQLTKALARLSVCDNMMLAAPEQRGERFLPSLLRRAWAVQERDNGRRAEALLEQFGLAHMRDEYAGELSGGQRKLLEMARALMAQPRLLMLDEPVAGVNPVLRTSILRHVQALRDEGMTILFIEHDMDVVMGISEWIVCMAQGRIIAEGEADHIAANEAVIDAYLGTRR